MAADNENVSTTSTQIPASSGLRHLMTCLEAQRDAARATQASGASEQQADAETGDASTCINNGASTDDGWASRALPYREPSIDCVQDDASFDGGASSGTFDVKEHLANIIDPEERARFVHESGLAGDPDLADVERVTASTSGGKYQKILSALGSPAGYESQSKDGETDTTP